MNEIKLHEYWERYKKDFNTPLFEKREKYKWPVFAQCYEKWNWESYEKAKMFSDTFSVKGSKNFWESGNFYPVAMLNQFFEIRSEDTIRSFNILFEENLPLEERISQFIIFCQDSLPKLKEKKPNDILENHYHGDLRALSIYLTLQYPEKYFFYKHTPFSEFSKLLELPKVKGGQIENYSRYIETCNTIRDFIKKDTSFLDTYTAFCNAENNYKDPYLHLLVQDFMYTVSSYLNDNTNYWVFQCNPDMFDLVTALDENLVETWTVTAHKDSIKDGDKAIIWMTGEEAGCYALADVKGEPEQIKKSKDDYLWKEEHTGGLKVRVKITHNFSEKPIYKSLIVDKKSLSGFKGGNQGTNFTSSKEEYDTFLSFSKEIKGQRYWIYAPGKNGEKWEEFSNAGIIGIGWDYLGDLKNYANKKEIVEKLREIQNTTSSKKNDATANYEFCNVMKPGDVIFAKKGKYEFIGYGIVKSDYYYDDSQLTFKSRRKIDWQKKGSWKSRDIVTKTLTDITSFSDYCTYIKQLFEEQNTQLSDMNTYSLNTILYGPPGTGKTYHSVKRAAEIIKGQIIPDYEEARKIFNENLGNQIEFITFHQNYSYEDFIQGLRPDTENGNQLNFQKKDGIFKKIAVNALFEYYKKLKSKSSKIGSDLIDLNEVYLDFVQLLKGNENKEFDTATGLKIYISDFTKNDNIEFKHQNSSRSYLVSGSRLIKLYNRFNTINQIKNVHNDIRDAIGGCNTTVYFVALREFIKFKEKYVNTEILESQEEYNELSYESKKKLLNTVELNDLRALGTEEVPPYVMIIDEINRANISRVFGELITLIEPDKRSHGEIPLKCTLPSGDEFIVPSNLYIIGTMNTADKSIALLDIALRRRFEFKAMYPDYQISGVNDVEILQKINETIINKKGHDFQIGHSYFMDKSQNLVNRLNKKVIPLLLEYFMNDKKEVTEILVDAGLKVNSAKWPLEINEY
jgi:5-methylcytosine-specific restriction protein B